MKIVFTQFRDLEGSGRIVKPGDTMESTDPAEVATMQAYVQNGIATEVVDKQQTKTAATTTATEEVKTDVA